MSDNSAYTIHRLEPGETYLFKDLNQMFYEVFGAEFGDTSYATSKPEDAYFEHLLSRQHIIPLVALAGGIVIGGLVAYVLEKFEQERSEIHIYDLAVRSEYRRRGVARGLISELKKIGQKIGAWVIYVQADKDEADLPARKLYESLGEREDVFHYDIAVN